jgi:hypothetical protein
MRLDVDPEGKYMSQPSSPVASRNDWIRDLATLSPTVADIARGNSLPLVSYRDSSSGAITEIDAFNFSNDDDHNRALARCFDGLGASGVKKTILCKYLTDLTSGRSKRSTNPIW